MRRVTGKAESTSHKKGPKGFVVFTFENDVSYSSELTNDLSEVLIYKPPDPKLLKPQKKKGLEPEAEMATEGNTANTDRKAQQGEARAETQGAEKTPPRKTKQQKVAKAKRKGKAKAKGKGKAKDKAKGTEPAQSAEATGGRPKGKAKTDRMEPAQKRRAQKRVTKEAQAHRKRIYSVAYHNCYDALEREATQNKTEFDEDRRLRKYKKHNKYTQTESYLLHEY